MRLKENSTEQKLRGAYYTPVALAQAMVDMFTDYEIESVLEPSCGDGVFLDCAVESGLMQAIEEFVAVEIDSAESAKLNNRYSVTDNITILNEDFLRYYEKAVNNKSFDLILGNPPYIRYQYLSEQQREIQSKILTSNGMKSNKLINSWVCFLVACVQLLSSNGKIAFVIPAEILQVAYAEDLRLFLSNNLSKITLLTFEKLVFPNIEQEVVVFIGEKGNVEKGIRIIELRTLDDLKNLDLQGNGFQEIQHLKEKWTRYFITAEENELIKSIKVDKRFRKFSDCALINVGITTGNNKFFSISETTEKKYELESVCLKLIGRSSHADGLFFNDSDWQNNINKGKNAYLINFPDIPFNEYPEKHKKYITTGEKMDEHKGYKCTIRDRWYIVPSIWVPDAFFLRRNNLFPKFVLNCCDAVSTDTMHRVKFHEGIDKELVLLSYYNSISFAFTELCGRSYGGGVLELLPRETGNIMMPNIKNIELQIKNRLLFEIDLILRENSNIEKALDIVDREVLVNILNIDPAICDRCRVIWRKMQNRRLGRGN